MGLKLSNSGGQMNKDLDGITLNDRPIKDTINKQASRDILDGLRNKVYIYNKPRMRHVEKRSASPVKRYSRGEINQTYGKTSAAEACKAGKPASYVTLHLLLTGKPVQSKDVLEVYSACSKKITQASISGALKRISSSEAAPLFSGTMDPPATWTLNAEATGMHIEDLANLANRTITYSAKDLARDYPELEKFFAKTKDKPTPAVKDKPEPTVKPEPVVKPLATEPAAAAPPPLQVQIQPIKAHFTFDFNFNFTLNLKR